MTDTTTPEVRIKSADDLIVGDEARKLGNPLPTAQAIPEVEHKQTQEKAEHSTDQENDQESDNDEETETEQPLAAQEQDKPSDDTPLPDENLDEYGNSIAAKKTYTEEEVQAMIRKRLKDRHVEQPVAAQKAAEDFKPDPESEESWEKQLGDFVEKKINDISVRSQQLEQEKMQRQKAQEFEVKFETGMQKYKDFENVVSGKPITGAMMAATGEMTDPAAFLYAACKQQPGEIERIAKLQSATAQMVEIGRLEERMKKAKIISTAPKPAKRISGDATNDMPKVSIDQLISTHAKSKIVERRK